MRTSFRQNPRFLFWTLILLAVSLTIFLAACAPASPAAQADGPRDDCGLIEPTDEDVQYILSLGKDNFTSADWVKSYTVEPYKVTVSRSNEVEAAIAYTEYLIYTCGYGQSEMDSYFNDEGFNIIFEGYESHSMAQFCEKKELALYKFDLVNEGEEYIANYWVKQATDTRVLVMMLVFPKSSAAQLEEYSKNIFPELTACK